MAKLKSDINVRFVNQSRAIEIAYLALCNLGLFAVIAYAVYATENLWSLLALVLMQRLPGQKITVEDKAATGLPDLEIVKGGSDETRQ